jgi:hypothetical protein
MVTAVTESTRANMFITRSSPCTKIVRAGAAPRIRPGARRGRRAPRSCTWRLSESARADPSRTAASRRIVDDASRRRGTGAQEVRDFMGALYREHEKDDLFAAMRRLIDRAVALNERLLPGVMQRSLVVPSTMLAARILELQVRKVLDHGAPEIARRGSCEDSSANGGCSEKAIVMFGRRTVALARHDPADAFARPGHLALGRAARRTAPRPRACRVRQAEPHYAHYACTLRSVGGSRARINSVARACGPVRNLQVTGGAVEIYLVK